MANIIGGNGYDLLIGTPNDDFLDGRSGRDELFAKPGNDSLFGRAGNDELYGGRGNDTLDGGVGNDKLEGGNDLDRLYGGAGNDELYGEDSNDTLYSGAGNDYLSGGGGNDTLTSGGGYDIFNFYSLTEGIDIVTDFSSTTDRIQINDNGFARELLLGPITAAQFRLGSSAQDTSDRLIYNRSTGALYFDSDGTGSASQVQFAALSGSPFLSNNDIFVV